MSPAAKRKAHRKIIAGSTIAAHKVTLSLEKSYSKKDLALACNYMGSGTESGVSGRVTGRNSECAEES